MDSLDQSDESAVGIMLWSATSSIEWYQIDLVSFNITHINKLKQWKERMLYIGWLYSTRNNDYLFIVDPVDGTKDFVSRDDEFTTNIALAYKGEVVLGVISIPATKEIYYAIKGQGAYYLKEGNEPIAIHVNDKLNDLIILTSRFHVTNKENEIIEKNKDRISKVTRCGSSIKACLIAKGEGEVSFRLGSGTKEWDTAASQIIVEEAGGIFAKPDLSKITYNRLDVYNREGFVILNRKENIDLMK